MRYYRLRFDVPRKDRQRVIGNLQALRQQLDAEVPSKDADQNLLLGTWNIRDLGKKNRHGFGARLPESHFYIAEVLSRFDFVAVQEVNDLAEWGKVMNILGRDWDYIATDVTDSGLGGNGERLTYLFDKRKVHFQNVAGEIVLPADMLISKVDTDPGAGRVYAGKQFRRSPFFARFQSGWFKFDICTVHIYYGQSSGAKLQERVEEIEAIASYLGRRADRELEEDRALILLGDFNIVHPDHETMKALTENGFRIPKTLQRPSNLDRTKYYDQIAFKTKSEILEYVDSQASKPKNRNAGIFELFDSVFTDDQYSQFRAIAAKTSNGKKKTGAALKTYYRSWRTYQFSDHKPMWVRLKTNDSAAYLETLAAD